MGKTSTTIRLTRMPYNSDSATAFGLGWKLGYAFDNPVRPRLEVFVDNDVARDGDWSTYGIPPEAPAHLATTIAFAAVGDEQPVDLGDMPLTVRFVAIGSRTITYAKGGPEEEPVYDFVIARERWKNKRPSKR
jgi:hypothetical protein